MAQATCKDYDGQAVRCRDATMRDEGGCPVRQGRVNVLCGPCVVTVERRDTFSRPPTFTIITYGADVLLPQDVPDLCACLTLAAEVADVWGKQER